MLDSIVGIATGLGGKLIDAAKEYFPPAMSDAEKKAAELEMLKVAHEVEVELLQETTKAQAEFNQRIKDLEGTAKDLKVIPIIGPLVIFLRGLQRPVWGFAVMWIDFNVFSGIWKLETEMLQNAFWLVNFLVLGFLFGERALQNVLPFLERFKK
jgi:hypothetical protein